MVKIRQKPEDFRVIELGGPEPDTGDTWASHEHRLYRLEKKSHDSLSLLAHLSRSLSVPRRSFGLAGLKDRHAVTSQLVTIPSSVQQSKLPEKKGESIGDLSEGLIESGWRLTLLGGVESKLRSGHHSGNRFQIVVRDLTHEQVQGLGRRLSQAQEFGWPNWFDSQRFGSAVKGRLPGSHIVKGEFEEAMRIHLSERNKSDRSDKRRDKRKFTEAWPEIGRVQVEHKLFFRQVKAFRKASQEGLAGEDLWREVYLSIPFDIRGIWLSAWQAAEWNHLLVKLLTEIFDKSQLYSVDIGVGGPLLYPESPAGKRGGAKRAIIEQLTIGMKSLPEQIKMPHSELDLSSIDQYLSSNMRPTWVEPTIEASVPEPDDLNGSPKHKRWKVNLSFDLPSGAYATVLVKRLFH